MRILAHGVGSREDLPLPFGFALTGAVVALLVSFLALGLLWRQPRLQAAVGRAAPAALAAVVDSRWWGALLQALGLLATAYVVMAAVFGRDDALNPVPGVVFVLLWIGMPLLSVLLGPVWRWLNPIRTLHLLLSRVIGTRPEEGMARLPEWLGYWPAALSLFSFVWLELAAPENTTLPVLRAYFAVYAGVNLVAATYFGSRWFDRGDGFEVLSSLLGRFCVLGRRDDDGRLVWRNPLAGIASTPVAPGLYGVVGVMLGSTVFDSFSSSPVWVGWTQELPLPEVLTATLGLLGGVLLVTAVFSAAAALTAKSGHLDPSRAAGELAHSIVPIVVGYLIAHYWSLLVLIGQQTVIQLSDPLGTGANWLGTGGRAIDPSLADPTLVSVIQVGSVVTGHVLGVVLAHDRAIALLPREHAIRGQLPLLVLMVGYTVGGLWLLFAA